MDTQQRVPKRVLDSMLIAVVLGMTTLPAVTPGDPVCHLAIPRGGIRRIREALSHSDLTEKLKDDLASSVDVRGAPT